MINDLNFTKESYEQQLLEHDCILNENHDIKKKITVLVQNNNQKSHDDERRFNLIICENQKIKQDNERLSEIIKIQDVEKKQQIINLEKIQNLLLDNNVCFILT